MAVKDNQLARIVAPGLDEVDYSVKMAIAFSNINENFKKIASLPFLQGVAGDSYQLQEYKIIVKQNDPETDDLTINNTLCLTKEGASLFNTIFDTNIFTEGNYFNDICDNTDINKDLNGKKVLDFFIDENGNIINNKLYFYVIKNDADEVIEDSKHLGQYFYFVDGRIKELGNAYYNTDKTSITDFNDYSGFFQYNPETETYYRVNILPTLYYDAAKNDICWKFYGKETGISAIGVAGANGSDATFQFVKVEPTNEYDCSAQIKYIFDFNAQNTTDYWIPVNNSDILNGPAVISIETQDDNKSIAFGQIIGETAYWDNNTVLNNLVTSETISKYFYNMGFNQGNYPLFLAIPMSYNRNDNNPEKNNAHTIYSNEDSDLVFRGVENAWIGSDGIQQNYNAKTDEKHNVVFENYNLHLNNNSISNVNSFSGSTITATNHIKSKTIEATDITATNHIKSKTIEATEHIKSNVNNVPGVEVGVPVGSIVMWPSMNPPEGWIECNGLCIPLQEDGKTVHRDFSEFQKLATMLLNSKRDYNNTSTYKLSYNNLTSKECVGSKFISAKYFVVVPNFKQRFPAGYNLSSSNAEGFWSESGHIGSIGGSDKVKLTAEESGLPSHNHTGYFKRNASGAAGGPIITASAGDDDDQHMDVFINSVNKKDAEKAHENLPPYILTSFIIKYK